MGNLVTMLGIAASVVAYLYVLRWIALDMDKRGGPGGLVAAVAVLFPVVGLLLYFFL
jgi:hypothetical protein